MSKPRERPGYRFSIGWPPGYEPQPSVEQRVRNVEGLKKGRDVTNARSKSAGEGIFNKRWAKS